MTVDDARLGQGRIYVRSKGKRGVKQPLVALPEEFAWLMLQPGEMALTQGLRPGPVRRCGGPDGAHCAR